MEFLNSYEYNTTCWTGGGNVDDYRFSSSGDKNVEESFSEGLVARNVLAFLPRCCIVADLWIPGNGYTRHSS